MPRHLTDVEKARIRTLYTDGELKIPQIIRKTGYSKGQVNRALFTPEGPRRRKGPPPALSPTDKADLIAFVTASRTNRLLPWHRVAQSFRGGQYGYKAIFNALRRLGFKRYRARLKPPICERNRQKRLAFALAY
jgi:transposase